MPDPPDSPDSPDRDDRSGGGWSAGVSTYAEYSVVAFVFPAALAIGFFAGRWVGSLLGGPMVGSVVGVLLGSTAGFYNLWDTLRRIERREAEKAGGGAADGSDRPEDDGGPPA